MEFDNFTSLFTPCFVLIEKIYQTLETVPVFHWLSKHLKLRQKILHCPSYFQLSSLCLDIPMKHCLSCLIYYLLLRFKVLNQVLMYLNLVSTFKLIQVEMYRIAEVKGNRLKFCIIHSSSTTDMI